MLWTFSSHKSKLGPYDAQSAMKSKLFIVGLLGLLIVASADGVPDPPAVTPHAVSVVSFLHQAARAVFERRLNFDGFSTPSHSRLQTHWMACTSGHEPSLPSDRIIITGYAADPSPPVLETPRNV
jgi:hypothetical protein